MKSYTPATVVERMTRWVGSVPSLLIHTLLFIGAFLLAIFSVASWEMVLLTLTTIVSLEAIYLAIFIQFTVNRNTESLREVEEDIDEIQEDVEELGEDVDEIQEDLEELTEDDERDQERRSTQKVTLEQLTSDVRRILEDLENLKKGK